jgi:hypothetical protein
MSSHWCDYENENCGMKQNVKIFFKIFSAIEAVDKKIIKSCKKHCFMSFKDKNIVLFMK